MIEIIKQQIYKPIDIYRLNKIKAASIYSYKEITREVYNLFTREYCIQNDFYYNAHHLKKYCGISNGFRLKAAMEHAVYYDDSVWDADINHSFENIITLSEARKLILEARCDKKVIKVGPYIAYADSLWDEEKIKKEKDKNGRTLIVFPSHSTMQVNMSFNVQELIKKIYEIGSGYDTIIICMYWKDVLQNKHFPYEKEGFKIVSAGHMFDPQFLPRLKTIISISDQIMANDFGSFIGQAVYLNKSCYLYQMECNAEAQDEKFLSEYQSKGKIYHRAFELFSNIDEKITDEQYEFCNYVWGNNEVKTKEELKNILMSL